VLRCVAVHCGAVQMNAKALQRTA